MSEGGAYVPKRDFVNRVKRRLTQWRAARPTHLKFDAPILSICFDDFPVSAAEVGAGLMESHGARGTFYAAAGLAETDGPCGRNFSPAHARTLAARGHEIGCHTLTHEDCATRDPFATLTDLARNRDALMDMGCPAPESLAYPYGETRGDLKRSLPTRITAARGILPGLNVGRADLAQLHAFPLFGAGGMGRAHDALAQAAKRNAWMIAFTHDVSAAPSPWGTSIGALDTFLTATRNAGVVVLPVSAALKRRV